MSGVRAGVGALKVAIDLLHIGPYRREPSGIERRRRGSSSYRAHGSGQTPPRVIRTIVYFKIYVNLD
jgi:hypothetical protein